jgi:hypothetical protein
MSEVAPSGIRCDHWRTSGQKQYCMATAPLDSELRLCQIKVYRYLPRL